MTQNLVDFQFSRMEGKEICRLRIVNLCQYFINYVIEKSKRPDGCKQSKEEEKKYLLFNQVRLQIQAKNIVIVLHGFQRNTDSHKHSF